MQRCEIQCSEYLYKLEEEYPKSDFQKESTFWSNVTGAMTENLYYPSPDLIKLNLHTKNPAPAAGWIMPPKYWGGGSINPRYPRRWTYLEIESLQM